MTESTNSYTLHELLGSGGFSTVRRATDNATNRLIALKLTERNPDKVSADYLANFDSEVAALNLLSHSHIVKKISEDQNWVHRNEDGTVHSYLCIALELCPNGVLHDVVLRSKGFPEDLGRTYFRQLMKAVKYCHEMGVVHRDLKPENLLLDENFDLKIADFGSAKVRNLPSAHAFGTQKFWPPEVRPGQEVYDPKIDVYDCGLILYFMLFSELTLCSAFQYKRYLSDKAGFWSRRTRSLISATLLDLLNAMLEPEPQLRISVANVLTHPWTTGSTLSPEDLQAEMTCRMS